MVREPNARGRHDSLQVAGDDNAEESIKIN